MLVADLLNNSLSPDATTRQDATNQLESASRENYPAYLAMLSTELANEHGQPHIRNAAGLAMKNSLTARDAARQAEYEQRWFGVLDNTRAQVKQDALRTLASTTPRAASVAAQLIAAIAAIELPLNMWQDLIEVLLGYVNHQNPALRVAALQTIGFICETIKPEILSLRANEILTAVVHGARKEEPSPEVQLAAINALYNSLEFVRENFEREGERNYIMQVLCEATQSPSVPVQVAVFECLVRIMGLYYDKMGLYMERALFGLTVMGMKHPEENVALQAVEFWSTICEEEIDLAMEETEAMEYGETPENESRFFARIALPQIAPVLLGLLTRQEEDADEDEWNVSMAAGTCVGLLAQAVGEAIVPHVLPFIEAHIKSADWHEREAAVMAFGAMLDGPDPGVVTPLVAQALPILIDMMRDTNAHVKDTTAWTLGRICDLLSSAIKLDVNLHPLVSALVAGLDESPRVTGNCAWGLMNLSDQLSLYFNDADGAPATGPLSPYFDGIVTALLRVTERPTNEGNFRTSAYEALASYVTHSAADTLPVVSRVIVTILSRMETLLGLQNEILGADDRSNWNDLQGNLSAVVIAVTRRLERQIQPLADRIMTIVLQLLQTAGKASTVVEDAFLVVGTLAAALEGQFSAYIPAFLPYLFPALQAHEDTQLCTVAVGIIGDITRALGEQAAQYAGAFMNVLLENLRSEVLARTVKIPILACFGDVALATGAAFAPFLDTAMAVLRQAGNIQSASPVDFEMLEYVNNLREGILEAYVGIVSGLKPTEKCGLLLPHVASILELIQRTLLDDERVDIGAAKLGIGLIGDLADCFPNGQIKDLLLTEWISVALKTKGRGREIKATIRWAKEMVKRATQ